MLEYHIPYGVAITLRLGSLRDSDPATKGAFVTPTFAAGDVQCEQDDGSGFENADDPTPDLDGASVELDISAAEASPPAALGGRRLYRIKDQDGPVWVPREFIIVTHGNSHLAAFPEGVARGFTPQAVAAGSVTLDAAAQTEIVPTGMIAVVVASDEPLDLNHCGLITGWVSGTQVAAMAQGWTRTPTGTTSSLRIALYPELPQTVNQASAQVGAAAAINTFDPPTQAEMDAALAGLVPEQPTESGKLTIRA